MDSFNYAQKKRLAYIDFKLMFFGHFSRSDVVTHFNMGLSNATPDINLYKELAGSNLAYDNAEKCDVQTENFKPLFDYDPHKAMSQLTHYLSDSIDANSDIKFPIVSSHHLSVPRGTHRLSTAQAQC